MVPFKQLVAKEKKALLFLLKLLLLLCLLKCIFFVYNYNLSGGWAIEGFANAWQIVKWSLLYDALILAMVNLPFYVLLLVFGKK